MLSDMVSDAAVAHPPYDPGVKKRVRLKIDKKLLAALAEYGLLDGRSLDDVVGEALQEAVDVESRRRALEEYLEELDERFGPPGDEAMAAAQATWDELDAMPAPEARGS
jgi:hypothetical protein